MLTFDFHIHCGSFPQWDLELSAEACVALLERERICGAVVLPSLHQGDTAPELNLPTLQIGKVYRHLLPFYWLNVVPSGVGACVARHLPFLDEHRDDIFGLKYHPSISQIRVDHADLKPAWHWLSRNPLGRRFVLVHSGRSDISNGENLYELAREFPGVTWVIAHLGGGVFDKIMECLQFFGRRGLPPNILFDMAQTTHPVLVRRAVDMLGDECILYGSDEPFLDTRIVKNILQYSGIGAASQRKIAFENARRVFAQNGIDLDSRIRTDERATGRGAQSRRVPLVSRHAA